MSGEWLMSFVCALLIAFAVILVFTLIIAVVAWARQGCCETPKNGCPCPDPLCPVFVRNPDPDDRTFLLARVDGSVSGTDNLCATGAFTIQRTGENDLLYTVTTPVGTFITDIYTLEVGKPCDFPLTTDGCAVDLTAFHHASYPCDTTSNVRTFTSTITAAAAAARCHSTIYTSILVVFSTDAETCTPVQMMTLATGKPITLTGNCVTNPCPADSCCDPIVPNFTKIKIPKCRLATVPTPLNITSNTIYSRDIPLTVVDNEPTTIIA